jgi:hypothetical protein
MISSHVIVEAKTGEAQDSWDGGCTAGESGTGVGTFWEKFGRREETASVRERSWAETKLRVVEDRLVEGLSDTKTKERGWFGKTHLGWG